MHDVVQRPRVTGLTHTGPKQVAAWDPSVRHIEGHGIVPVSVDVPRGVGVGVAVGVAVGDVSIWCLGCIGSW